MNSMISVYTYLFLDFSRKLYCCIICSGNTDKGICMYSYRSNRVHRYLFLMLTDMCLALMVLMMLLHNIFDVVISDVLVLSSPE